MDCFESRIRGSSKKNLELDVFKTKYTIKSQLSLQHSTVPQHRSASAQLIRSGDLPQATSLSLLTRDAVHNRADEAGHKRHCICFF